MEKAIKIMEEIADKQREAAKVATDYLKRVLKENGNRIDIEESSLSVNYDGGRHPEYASNCFSTVYGVFLKDDKVYLETEDCEEYGIDRIDNDEIYNVASYLYEEVLK